MAVNDSTRDPSHHAGTALRSSTMKILLPVDGSDYTKRMLGFVAAHDELFGKGNAFTVCTVVAPIPVYATRFLEQQMVADYYDEQAEQVLGPVRKFAAQHD